MFRLQTATQNVLGGAAGQFSQMKFSTRKGRPIAIPISHWTLCLYMCPVHIPVLSSREMNVPENCYHLWSRPEMHSYGNCVILGIPVTILTPCRVICRASLERVAGCYYYQKGQQRLLKFKIPFFLVKGSNVCVCSITQSCSTLRPYGL